MADDIFLRARTHALYRILNTPVRTWPHRHLYVENVFPDDFYARLRASMPAAEAYTPLASTGKVARGDYEMRAGFLLDNTHLGRVPAEVARFWTGLFDDVLGEEFARELLRRHRDEIAQRLASEQAPPVQDPARDMILVRDGSSDGVKIHTSDPRNLLTLLFYLPADDAHVANGTTLYLPKERSRRCWGGPHHDFDGFDEVATMPYRANSLFMFVKDDTSFHGVKPIHETGLRRDLLLYYLHR